MFYLLGTNRSDGFRKSISCHYAAAECTYMDDIRGTEHENIAREIIELVGKKRNLSEEAIKNIRFADAWRYKARLVHGVPVNM